MSEDQRLKLKQPKSEAHKQAFRKPKKNKPTTSSQKGKHWYTNGIVSVSCLDGEQPIGFVRGRVI